jgi:hypothetical protein
VPVGVVDRGLSRPLADNMLGGTTWLDAHEPPDEGDLTRKRSQVQILYGPPGRTKKSNTSKRLWGPFRGPTVLGRAARLRSSRTELWSSSRWPRHLAGAGCSGMRGHVLDDRVGVAARGVQVGVGVVLGDAPQSVPLVPVGRPRHTGVVRRWDSAPQGAPRGCRRSRRRPYRGWLPG